LVRNRIVLGDDALQRADLLDVGYERGSGVLQLSLEDLTEGKGTATDTLPIRVVGLGLVRVDLGFEV
jgi:hypothetical protein